MTAYVLNLVTWRCGDDGCGMEGTALGEGQTELLNSEGFMCCLGQFSIRRHIRGQGRKVTKVDAIYIESPSDLAYKVKGVYDPAFVVSETTESGLTTLYRDTPLAQNLIRINDDSTTTIRTKIRLMRAALENEGHTLTVTNEHLLDKLAA